MGESLIISMLVPHIPILPAPPVLAKEFKRSSKLEGPKTTNKTGIINIGI